MFTRRLRRLQISTNSETRPAADAAGNDSDADQSTGMTSLVNLSIGEAERGVDAGMVDPGTASIGDYVWFDANRNGIQDANEEGVEGVEVKLLDAAGNVLATTTTNNLGGYLFENLDAGSYKVMFGTKDGLIFTASSGAADAAGNDSDADQTTGMTSVVELSIGEDERGVDAGLVKIPGALSGTYFCDEDRDNVDDGAANGDPDIAGKTVMLFEADGTTPATDIDGNPVVSVLTDANGNYRFDNLAEGDYVVKFEDSLNEGKGFVEKDQGGDDTVDSDVDPDSGKTDPVRVNAGEETTDVDAGVKTLDRISIDLEKLICETPHADFTPKAAPEGPEVIGQAGTLRMEQASRDGWVRVDFDAPIDDAVVVATVNTAEGSAPVVLRVRNVDDGGFEVQMQEWDYDDGAHVEEMISWMAISRGVHTLADGRTISAGTDDLTDDWGRFDYNGAEFGADAPSVFAQVNNSGDGDVVTVRVDNVNNGGFAARLQSQQSYAAHDQASSVDWIAVGRGVSTDNGGLAAWTTGAQATEARQRFSFSNAGFEESPVILLQAQTANGADTAVVRGDGKNTENVWLHVEEEQSADNEIRHTGENIGIMALSSGLLLSDGTWGASAANTAAAAADAAHDDCHDADTEADAVQLALGAEFTYKFEVTNNGEVDLRDIVLTDNNTTPGDASDDFAPEAVTSGGFNVGDVNQDNILNVGETWIYQAAGTAEMGVHVNNAVVKGTSVSDNRMVTDEDPAVYVARDPGTASIGDRVWLDSNKNGRQDAGESGVANVTVKLLDADGNVLETTTTNNGGWYLFDNLDAGDYQVMFVKPGNYSFTITDGGAADELGNDSDADRTTGMTSLVNLDIGENEDRVDAGLFENGRQICASVKASGGGNRTWSTEQWAEWISVKTDRPVSTDTTFTITLMNGSATYGQDMWFGTYGNRLDFTKGAQAQSTTITIKAGQSIGHVADNKKLIIWQERFGTENTESFTIKITKVQGNGVDTFKCLDSLDWDIYDTPTPVAFDLNGDGRIGVTGATTSYDKTGLEIADKTVSFDINGDGEEEQVEWLSGDGDAFLFDNRDGNALNDMNGSRLFGNADGHANGYEKLAGLDVNGDGMLTGEELEGLQLWVDNGDAILTADEILTLAEAGITAISTEMEIIESEDGRELMRSVAETEDGRTIMTEDVWFMHG